MNELLTNFYKGDIDILLLPEMAFTGYVFDDLNHIYPYLEEENSGPTVTWARRQALRLSAFVVVGYPQILKEQGGTEKHYNSACFVDRDGNLITTYQKSFLYDTDERWADEGPGFKCLEVDGLGKVGIGICMDLNPYQYKDFFAFEFATFHRKEGTKIILCPMNWLDSNPSPPTSKQRKTPVNTQDDRSEAENADSDEESNSVSESVAWSSLEYWKRRLAPLCINEEKVIFASCNRFGTESGSTFCGTSCVMSFMSPRPVILGYLKKREKAVLVVELDQDNKGVSQ
ncbi:carbon-nitrogen hydrolase [Endogone sp. FLAS-F59071]|nr:carbon-nitrogen hydrolase [Endogone sp. FLAS-F59071]|eukprot:RUS21052.1 carbon-nitrogen hydrolase [Endogone sp. FLAS-F59071]